MLQALVLHIYRPYLQFVSSSTHIDCFLKPVVTSLIIYSVGAHAIL